MILFDREGEEKLLFGKKYECPICKEQVLGPTVKTGMAKLEGTDPDLRPRYQGIDSLKYDVVMCGNCGYAAVKRFFNQPLVAVQIHNVKEKIVANYNKTTELDIAYDYDEAIRRHKLALISAITKNAEVSEKAYTVLKMGWIYRGYADTLDPEQNEKRDALKKEEMTCLRNAFQGFQQAYTEEDFPICGMDQGTFFYLIAYLGYMCEEYQKSSYWLGRALTDRSTSDRVKNRAWDLKELLKDVLI